MACRNHPAVLDGIEYCAICAETYCGECVVEFQGKRTCADCKAQIVADLEVGGAPGGAAVMPPWERRNELGFVGAFFGQCKVVMSEPTAYFERVDTNETRWDSLVFAIIIQVLVAVSTWIFMGLIFGAMFAGQQEAQAEMFGPFAAAMSPGIFQVLFAPVGAVLGMFIGAGLFHVMLLIMKQAKRPFHQTVRHYCYANAPGVLGVIPIVGGLAGIWSIVLTVFMIKHVHRTTWGTAVAAVLVPFVVLICGGVVFVMLMIGAMSSMQ